MKESIKFLLLISFVEGAMVMATELLSAKMITPYFGATVPVWSSVLGITMLGLSLGYFVGGRISVSKRSKDILYRIILVASILTCLLPVIGPAIMDKLIEIEDFRIAAVLSSLLFILPVMFCYGMVPPLVIHKISSDIDDAGTKTGRVYAVSTVGGVLMTLLTGFYLLPEIGIRHTAIIVGAVFGLCAVYFLLKSKSLLTALVVLFSYFLVSFFSLSQLNREITNPDFAEVYSTNTLHGSMKVIDYKLKETRALYNNNISQSYMHLPTGRSQWTYVHRLATYTSFLPAGSEVFLVGLGGGNLVTEFNLLKFQVDVCDIEPRTVEIARNYFGMPEPRSITIDDARHKINNCQHQYDLVVLDVSAGEIQPSNLYTVEGFSAIKKMLKENGVVFIHYPTVMGGEEALALKSILKTMEEVGFKVGLINTGPYPDIIREQFVVASLHDFNLEQQNFDRRLPFAEPFGFVTSGDFMLDDFDYSKGLILTDDMPIMDELHYGISQRHRKDGINVTVKGMLNSGLKMF
ncbi:MAG: fused MFS/spermidine synthase [Flavobacteriales bacterium]|nr:fused MFS/spermidine synthase [Flavobacteriales bacterium]